MIGVQIYKIWNKIGSKRNKKRLWIFLIKLYPAKTRSPKGLWSFDVCFEMPSLRFCENKPK
jgi:hypothetical protein